jgi:alanine-glyoxylate transaminase/serine-glyoxylate transaminase/serine-pyruvate transaminase
MTVKRGNEFLHTPGPTNIPGRILNAMHRPSVDFVSPEFSAISDACFAGLKPIFQTEGEMFIYAGLGHGAWEAALANTLSPGDRILVPETGNFSLAWSRMAEALGVVVDHMPNDWRHAVDAAEVEARLREDTEWGVDVSVGAGQKGLMLPPGISFTAVSEKALRAGHNSMMPRRYWDWRERLGAEQYMRFCGTPPLHLIYGLHEAIQMIVEEGLDRIFARHQRLAEAVRRAVAVWGENGGIEFNAMVEPERSNSVTTILVPDGIDAEEIRSVCRERFRVALGGGLGQLEGHAFRIGHMGDLNEPMVLGALAGVELGLQVCGVPYGKGGVGAAVDYLASTDGVGVSLE